MAVEVRALFDQEGQVMHIGFDVTGGLQGDRLSTDDTQDSTAHDHLLACDHPRYPPLLPDDDLGRLNVTLDVAIDLKHPPTNDLEPLTNDLEIVPYERLLSARGWGQGWLHIGRVGQRFGLDRRAKLCVDSHVAR